MRLNRFASNAQSVMEIKIVEISIPEYRIDSEPDYVTVGTKVDRLIGLNFQDGKYVGRAIGLSDHPGKSLDKLASIILELGTDKYDPDRKEVAHKAFLGYDHDIQGGLFEISGGKIVEENDAVCSSMFADFVYHFYEHTPLDRGYPVRIDILMIYYYDMLEQAKLIDTTASRIREGLERCLYRFKDTLRKKEALAGIVKILRD